MTFNELIKILEKANFKLVRTSKSSNRVYSNGERTINVHFHGKKEIATGTLKAILKQANIK